MKLIKIRRGDQALIGVPAILNGEPVDIVNVAEAEFVMGELSWTWPDTCVYEDGVFYLPITQEQTFALAAGDILPIEGRIRTNVTDVWVKGAEMDVYVHVSESTGTKIFKSEEENDDE